MRNKLLAGAMALALVGCAEKPAEDATTAESAAVSETEAAANADDSSAASTTPRIGINAAPGVAFDYAYTFALPTTASPRFRENMPPRAKRSVRNAAALPMSAIS